MDENTHHVGFHPMQNDATVSITRGDMLKVIELSDHKADVLDFSKPLTTVVVEEKKQAQPVKPVQEKPVGNQDGIQYKKEENFSKWY